MTSSRLQVCKILYISLDVKCIFASCNYVHSGGVRINRLHLVQKTYHIWGGDARVFFYLNFYLLLISLMLISFFYECQDCRSTARWSEKYLIASIATHIGYKGKCLRIFKVWVYLILCSLVLMLVLIGVIGGPCGASGHSPGVYTNIVEVSIIEFLELLKFQ